MADDPVGVLYQVAEQPELGRRQVHVRAPDSDGSAGRRDVQRPEPHVISLAGVKAFLERVDPVAQRVPRCRNVALRLDHVEQPRLGGVGYVDPRFSGDKFGIVAFGGPSQLEGAREVLRAAGAEEVKDV